MTSALTACVPDLPGRPGENARTQLQRGAKNDRPCDRARDHRRRQGERSEKSGVPLRGALSADDREPKADVPRTR